MSRSMTRRDQARRVWRRLRLLRGMNRFFAIMLVIGVPTGIFHFISGRYGNGILVTVAVLVGATMLVLDLSSGNRDWWSNPRARHDAEENQREGRQYGGGGGGREEWWN